MIRKIHFLVIINFIILFSSITFGAPGIPHQFYGKIYINNKLTSDNTILTASIEGNNYSTITKNGLYGQSPAPIFYIPDPEGNRNNKTIQFFVGNKSAGSYIFENAGYTKLNFYLNTTCGDGCCLGEENCSNCRADCGECPIEPLEISIHSPKNNKTYYNPNIPLEVSANQPIIVWMYSLNSGDYLIFTPNITIVAKEGVNNLTVIGVTMHDSESKTITFSFELPPCGNGKKEWGEECDGNDFGDLTCSSYGYNSGSLSCSSECTIITDGCYNDNGGNGGSSSSSSSSSGGGISSYTPPCIENWTCTDWSEECFNGVHTRNCTDLNNCGTTIHKPSEVQKCESVEGITYYCGDGLCSEIENCSTCKEDCGSCAKIDKEVGPVCGNKVCEEDETYETCCSDCGCPKGYECKDNKCASTTSFSSITGKFLTSPIGLISIIGGILVIIFGLLLYKKKMK